MNKHVQIWIDTHKEKWGDKGSRDRWLNNIVEEAAELIVAVQHYKRNRVSFNAVRTEMADVMINIMVLKSLEGPDGPTIAEVIDEIARRQVDILEGKLPPRHNDGEDEPPLPQED